MGSEPLVAFVVEQGAVSGEKILICRRMNAAFELVKRSMKRTPCSAADFLHGFGIEAEVFVG